MPTQTVDVIQHVAFEDLGHFGETLQTLGYAPRLWDAPLLQWERFDARQADLLVILGGPIGVNEQTAYPFLAAELAAVARRLEAGLPTLGICLGSQLIAHALGARVYPAREKEIGWQALRWTEAGKNSPLAELGDAPVLHWHGETFDLPAGAELLASTEVCPHQAFAVGKHCLALQFHPEVTASGLERWFVGHTHEIHHTPGLEVPRLRADTARHAAELRTRGARFLSRWLESH